MNGKHQQQYFRWINLHMMTVQLGLLLVLQYCSYFLNDENCLNPDCVYLHYYTEDVETVTKEEISGNTTLFMEQQKNAFHKLGLESELLEDFIRSMAPFKSKSTPQFPLPEFIFKKKFLFLTAPLTILQKTSPKPKEKTQESAKETEQTKKELVPPKNGLSRFGVQLTENEEADDSVVIPEQIQSILEQYRQSRRADSLPSAQQIGLIESLSLSKKTSKNNRCTC
eukprot:TRINITY_DN19218_c0_g1_i1.p2 TRINITY_DN19218_c0_g1~~TRINITY_DN19218_c0_g1_i1.p2  ORF type:complete len:225 (+),score=32.39 TRINITY_DN19218_c0_g1_i1:2-676(+)